MSLSNYLDAILANILQFLPSRSHDLLLESTRILSSIQFSSLIYSERRAVNPQRFQL